MKLFKFEQETEQRKGFLNPGAKSSSYGTIEAPEFITGINEAGFVLLRRGDALDLETSPNALSIGVAVWSQPDLRVLEALADCDRNTAKQVFVFSVDDFDADRGFRILCLLPHCCLLYTSPSPRDS